MKALGELLFAGGLMSGFVGVIGYMVAIWRGWEGTGPEHWTWNPVRFGLLAMLVGVILFIAAKLREHFDKIHGFR